MRHLGDICRISGYDVPIVDVVTGGSPCQDLSVAGNREGLDGKRSGLFDGQGGFPLCAVEVGMKPIWASEIDKHAIAVTRYHFPDETEVQDA